MFADRGGEFTKLSCSDYLNNDVDSNQVFRQGIQQVVPSSDNRIADSDDGITQDQTGLVRWAA